MNMEATLTALTAFHGLPLLALILGVISITRLITEDTLADKLRNWFFLHWPHEGFQSMKRPHRGTYITTSGGAYYVNVGTYLGKLVSCPWCTGFWVSAAAWTAFYFWPVGVTFFLLPLGIRVLPGWFQAKTD